MKKDITLEETTLIFRQEIKEKGYPAVAAELVGEIQNVQIKYSLPDHMLYTVAEDKSREEYFLKMYILLKEFVA